MRIHRYWHEQQVEIQTGERVQKSRIIAGSDVSPAEAAAEWQRLYRRICARIDGEAPEGGYEAAIYEHIAATIDSADIVTVNRYGALVLNTTRYTILDLDDEPFAWGDLWFAYRGLDRHGRIAAKFRQRLGCFPELGADLRIYATHSGVRVVAARYVDPADPGFPRLARGLGVDPLYAALCVKQRCYRARLTPKPYRMRMPAIRIRSPADCQAPAYATWAADYVRRARAFSTVRLLASLGRDFAGEEPIRHHDEVGNLAAALPLA